MRGDTIASQTFRAQKSLSSGIAGSRYKFDLLFPHLPFAYWFAFPVLTPSLGKLCSGSQDAPVIPLHSVLVQVLLITSPELGAAGQACATCQSCAPITVFRLY